MIWPFTTPTPRAAELSITRDAFWAEVLPPFTAALAQFRLTEVKRGTWLGNDGPVRPMFQLFESQGGAFVRYYGVALAFVPHLSGAKPAWHRTRASARMDIAVRCEGRDREVSLIRQATRTPAFINGALGKILHDARALWSAANDVAALPDLLEDVMAMRPDTRSQRNVQYPIVRAFIYKHLGQTAKAEAAWQVIADDPYYADAMIALCKVFDAGG